MGVWRLSMELSIIIAGLTMHLPKYEHYALNFQLRRCTNGILSKIAEGYGRKTSPDKIIFYVIASGSVFEAQSHLLYGMALGCFRKTNVMSI